MTTYNWAKKEHKTDKNWAETILLKAPLDALSHIDSFQIDLVNKLLKLLQVTIMRYL